jgi:hypothetical protein
MMEDSALASEKLNDREKLLDDTVGYHLRARFSVTQVDKCAGAY